MSELRREETLTALPGAAEVGTKETSRILAAGSATGTKRKSGVCCYASNQPSETLKAYAFSPDQPLLKRNSIDRLPLAR